MKVYIVYMPSYEERVDEVCCFSTREKAKNFIEELAERPDTEVNFFDILERELDLPYKVNEKTIYSFCRY